MRAEPLFHRLAFDGVIVVQSCVPRLSKRDELAVVAAPPNTEFPGRRRSNP